MPPIVAWAAVAPIVALALLLVRRARSRRAGAGEDDTALLPVSAAYARCGGPFGAMQRNGFRSFLSIAQDGIRFRVFSEARWSFADMDYVDVREEPSGTILVFSAKGGRRVFIATVADRAVARRALASLPATLPLTPEAAILRDGTADAATPGLRPYRGPLA